MVFPAALLRQLVAAQIAHVLVLHGRKHQELHKAFDKGGFAGADRSHNADIDLPSCSGLDIFVYIKIVHKYTPLLC